MLHRLFSRFSRSIPAQLLVASALPFLILSASAQAQNDPPAPILINVIQVQVKPSEVSNFMSFHREVIVPNNRAEGSPWRLMSGTVFGDSWNYTIATPLQNFAQLDTPGTELSTMALATVQNAIESRRRFVVTTRPDMAIPGDGGVMPLRRMARFQVRAGKAPEFEEFWGNTIRPALQNAGMSNYQVFQTVLGGPQGEYYGGVYIPSFAALDSIDVNTMLSERQQREFGELVEEFEIILQSVNQELSYGLPGL